MPTLHLLALLALLLPSACAVHPDLPPPLVSPVPTPVATVAPSPGGKKASTTGKKPGSEPAISDDGKIN